MNLQQLAQDNNVSVELLQQLQQLLVDKNSKLNPIKQLKQLLPQNNAEDKLVYLLVLLKLLFNCEYENETVLVREFIEENNIEEDVLRRFIISYIKSLFKDPDFKLRDKKTTELNESVETLTPFD